MIDRREQPLSTADLAGLDYVSRFDRCDVYRQLSPPGQHDAVSGPLVGALMHHQLRNAGRCADS